MTLSEFEARASAEGLPAPLQALWHDQKGDWDRAHELAQQASSPEGDWVHAYLHRKEGDDGNARYWYQRAGREPASGNLQAEWRAIVSELLPRTDNPSTR